MGEITYSLNHLSMFFNDLEEHVRYISDVLQNKTAANDLLDAVEAAILKRLPNAESFEPFHSIREHLYPQHRRLL